MDRDPEKNRALPEGSATGIRLGLDDLEGLRTAFRALGDADAEDIVLEVMDYLAGWCSPKMRI
jgi:hypothetical protein